MRSKFKIRHQNQLKFKSCIWCLLKAGKCQKIEQLWFAVGGNTTYVGWKLQKDWRIVPKLKACRLLTISKWNADPGPQLASNEAARIWLHHWSFWTDHQFLSPISTQHTLLMEKLVIENVEINCFCTAISHPVINTRTAFSSVAIYRRQLMLWTVMMSQFSIFEIDIFAIEKYSDSSLKFETFPLGKFWLWWPILTHLPSIIPGFITIRWQNLSAAAVFICQP